MPVTVTAWAVWGKPLTSAAWYLTADCLCWSLGTLSYYAVPTLGPNFAFPWLYTPLEPTGVSAMQDSLLTTRQAVLVGGPGAGVQSLAAFASLHVAITLMTCLVAHWTVRPRWVRTSLWAYLVLVTISTTYFGWHYIVDDVAGALIALVSVYAAGWATGYRFDRRGRLRGRASSAGPEDASGSPSPGARLLWRRRIEANHTSAATVAAADTKVLSRSPRKCSE